MAQNQSKKAVINANVALLGFVPKSNRRFEVYFHWSTPEESYISDIAKLSRFTYLYLIVHSC